MENESKWVVKQYTVTGPNKEKEDRIYILRDGHTWEPMEPYHLQVEDAKLFASASELLSALSIEREENKKLKEAINTLIDPVSGDFYVEYKAVILAIDRKKILKLIQDKQSKKL